MCIRDRLGTARQFDEFLVDRAVAGSQHAADRQEIAIGQYRIGTAAEDERGEKATKVALLVHCYCSCQKSKAVCPLLAGQMKRVWRQVAAI